LAIPDKYTIEKGRCLITNSKLSSANLHKLDMVEYFNFRKIPLDEWDRFNGSYDYDSCNNCVHSDVRISTGCHWCLHMGCIPVGFDEICDLHVKQNMISRWLWEETYFHWVEWDERWFKEQLRKKKDRIPNLK
jgi:hypothetical protein